MIVDPTKLTDGERAAMNFLSDAWNAYVILPIEHGDEQADFRTAINRAQDLLAIRLARRCDPIFQVKHAD